MRYGNRGAGEPGDITSVNPGTNLNGGGSSGAVTLNLDDPIDQDTIQAKDNTGLKLLEDSGTYGITIDDNGSVKIKLGDKTGNQCLFVYDMDDALKAKINSLGEFIGIGSAYAKNYMPYYSSWDVIFKTRSANLGFTFQNSNGKSTQRRVETIQTTDANPTTIASIAVAEGEAWFVEARIVGRESDGSNRAIYTLRGLFYRNTSGNVTQQGSTDKTPVPIESNAAWDADLVANTGTQAIDIKVTGANTVDWKVDILSFNQDS